MTDLKQRYLEALGLEPNHDSHKTQAAFARAHSIRQFEIELYWKRATYFWIFQAAIFTALGLIWKDTPPNSNLLPLGLTTMGWLTALAGWLSANGSKFWQQNWEAHIDFLEDAFEGNLHKTVWIGPQGVRWSVSGVNGRLSVCFVMFWAVLLLVVFLHSADLSSLSLRGSPSQIDLQFIGSCLTLLGGLAGALFLVSRGSALSGALVDANGRDAGRLNQSWPRIFTSTETPRQLLRRDAS